MMMMKQKINLIKPLNPYGDSKNDFDKWAIAQKQVLQNGLVLNLMFMVQMNITKENSICDFSFLQSN